MLYAEAVEDRAGPTFARAAFVGQPRKCVAGEGQVRNLGVERLDPTTGELANSRTIAAAIQIEQFANLAKGETRGLCFADEAQATEIRAAVAPDAAFSRWLIEQTLALVKTDRFDPDAGRAGKGSDRQRGGGLTPYHGTGVINLQSGKETGVLEMLDTATKTGSATTANLYRMVMPGHTCPYGLKAKDLLERSGYTVADHHLKTREDTDAFKEKHAVATTPQVFIGGQKIGGYDDLRRLLGKRVADPKATSYRPVIALFAMTAAMAMAASYAVSGNVLTVRATEWFVAMSMVVLSLLKLQNVETFATMFLNYDLLAKRWVRYSYIYPFAEGLAGVLMVAGALTWLSVPIALVIGTIGAVSVVKAVYIDKRELKCACVGGSSNVPLGFISLTENLMMVAMAIWMVMGH